jgi:hypothetical protein
MRGPDSNSIGFISPTGSDLKANIPPGLVNVAAGWLDEMHFRAENPVRLALEGIISTTSSFAYAR